MPGYRRKLLVYFLIILGSTVGGGIAMELYLAIHAPPRAVLPFYNSLQPYVMFRPLENSSYVTNDTYAMSHFKSRVYLYTNEDGFRIPAPSYVLPKEKPAGQLRIAFLGGSLVELASTFESALPGSLRSVLRAQYPHRDIEVINAGIQSCVSRQSLVELLLTVVDYHPDIVILYDGGNDLGMPLVYESRPNYPYNFQSMQDAWDLYRGERQQALWKVALERSNLYRVVRARWGTDERKMANADDAPFQGTHAMAATRILEDGSYVRSHVEAYLSNWRKLVELSGAYHYLPICILSPAGGLASEWTAKQMMQTFHLDRQRATEWSRALQLLYDEASRQVNRLRADYPQAVFLDLAGFLDPPQKYFSDGDHVYDEVNLILAQKIYGDARLQMERMLREVE